MPKKYLGNYNRLQTRPIPEWITRMLTDPKLTQLAVEASDTITTVKYYRYNDGSEVEQTGSDRHFTIEAGSIAEALGGSSFFVSDVIDATGRSFQLIFDVAAGGRDARGGIALLSVVTVSIRAYSGAGHAKPRSGQTYLEVLNIQHSYNGTPQNRPK